MALPKYLRLLLRPPTLDFETAVWELAYLLIRPRRVYKSLFYRHQTKSQWARDDPSFVVLLSALLVISALGWGLTYSPHVLDIMRLMLYMVVVDFLAVGVIIATVFYVFATKFLRRGTNFDVEWAYCFDVHCNSFLALWAWLYVVQWILLPIIGRSNWIAVFLGNSLYFGALTHYFYITFLGYSALPFLHRTQLVLAPVALFPLVYIFSLIARFSIVQFMLAQYFD